MRSLTPVFMVGLLATLSGCEESAEPSSKPPAVTGSGHYVLGSVVIDPDDARTTYVQTIESLDDGPFDNTSAIELPGNGVIMADEANFFVGLAEEPTWVRYTLDERGEIEETGRLSLANYGVAAIDYGNVLVDARTAVSVLSDPPLAVIWDPSRMVIRGEIELNQLEREGFELEVWTTVVHDGLVYIPGRWADWDGARVYPGVSTTILDPEAMKVLGTAEDDRCTSGGRVVFDERGYGYVMGDGRNYSNKMFANAAGEPAPADNCLLRIAPGATDYDEDYFHTIPSLTGGLESITELDTAAQGTGVGFSKMFYPDKLPEDVKPVDFAFWEEPAHKMWRIELSDPPTAKEVDDIPFAAIGFDGSSVDGLLYSGESGDDGGNSVIYEIDPETNRAQRRFEMVGYFYGLYRLGR